MPTPTHYLSVEEFGAVTGLSVSTVRRRIRDGSLPVFQPGGKKSRILIPGGVLTDRSRQEPVATPPEPAAASPTPSPPTLAGPRPRWTRHAPR